MIIIIIIINHIFYFRKIWKKSTETAIQEENKIEEQRAYATIGRVYLTKAQSLFNSQFKSLESEKAIVQAERNFLQSLLICKR